MKYKNPFDLDNHSAYEAWKTRKLEDYPQQAEELIVEVADPRRLTHTERKAILARCNKANMAVYVSTLRADSDKSIPTELGKQFGLYTLDRNRGADDDGITALQVVHDQWRNRYVPYTDRLIHWHTDGYYNSLNRQIRALLLHCVRPAHDGGENALLDHEIAYIRLRDRDPRYIEALMQPDAMTIPANIVDGHELRPARIGPVFSLCGDGRLHMRYTARAHNVIWRSDPITLAAVDALTELFQSQDPFIYRLKLQSGWGLISNNVLHDRSAFRDDESLAVDFFKPGQALQVLGCNA